VASAPHLAGTNDTGSIAWMLVSTALVFFMMPGLALFYGGMVRAKNVLNMFMLVMICVPLITVEWVAYGYDDSLDVVGVYGVGGALGALLVGVFCMRPVFGGLDQFLIQLQGLLWAGGCAFVCTLILGLLIDKTIGFTVGKEIESHGLDIAEHGESAYHLT